jgi:hypothetical protein
MSLLVGLMLVFVSGFYSFAQAQTGKRITFEVIDASRNPHQIQANCVLDEAASSNSATVFTNCTDITFRLSPGNYGELN